MIQHSAMPTGRTTKPSVVSVFVNNQPVMLYPGRYEMTTFFSLASIPHNHEVQQLMSGKLRAISGPGPISLVGDEVFVTRRDWHKA